MIDFITVNGNLGADARVGNKSENGAIPVSFPVLANKRYINRAGEEVEKTNRYSCTVWTTSDKYVGYLSNHLKKGAGVTLRGEPAPAFYTSKDGQIIPYITIRIDSLDINRKAAVVAEPTNTGSSVDESSASDTPPTSPQFAESEDSGIDDLPF